MQGTCAPACSAHLHARLFPAVHSGDGGHLQHTLLRAAEGLHDAPCTAAALSQLQRRGRGARLPGADRGAACLVTRPAKQPKQARVQAVRAQTERQQARPAQGLSPSLFAPGRGPTRQRLLELDVDLQPLGHLAQEGALLACQAVMSRHCVCAQNLQMMTSVVFLCTPSACLVYACDAVHRQEHMNLHA